MHIPLKLSVAISNNVWDKKDFVKGIFYRKSPLQTKQDRSGNLPLARPCVLALMIATLTALPTRAETLQVETTAPFESPADFTPFPDAIAEDYILGAGDLIELEIFNVPEHSGHERVLVDGSISLDWIGNVDVEGLTLDETADAIATAYAQYLKNPIITISLITPRPLQVSVAGAVNRPGSYQVDFAGENGSDIEAERRWPTLTKVLQQAGGITQLADIRQVIVERAIGRDGIQTIQVDLWNLISSGDLGEDLTLRDGDTIFVPTVAQVNPNEVSQLAAASFSPDSIQVNVVGEVNNPGVVEVPPNTPLNQALLAAGGFNNSRAQTGSVDLVRLNPDGSVSQREITVSFNQGINEETNPILYPDDVVIVKPSSTARFSDSADGLLNTLGLFLPFLQLFTP
ncbi:MAG: polysaccharide transporter [Leptolyngbya sp. SIO1D8]|nr:polysaccharide transporter [Leptolyngbya sp. SIO1D8]